MSRQTALEERFDDELECVKRMFEEYGDLKYEEGSRYGVMTMEEDMDKVSDRIEEVIGTESHGKVVWSSSLERLQVLVGMLISIVKEK